MWYFVTSLPKMRGSFHLLVGSSHPRTATLQQGICKLDVFHRHAVDNASRRKWWGRQTSIPVRVSAVFDAAFGQECGAFGASLIPLGIAVVGCRGLGMMSMQKELSTAVWRSSVQLFALAFILKFVFESNKLMASVLLIICMVLIAGHTAGERAKQLHNSHLVATASLAGGTFTALGLMVLLKAVPQTPWSLIPTAGYIIGNSMSMVGATLNGLDHDIRHHKGQIEEALALGASPRQAVKTYVQHAVKQGMSPWVDSIKTAGLITIPGTMTGLLMVNVQPLEVVRIQVQLLCLMLGAAALSCAISSMLAWESFFSKMGCLNIY